MATYSAVTAGEKDADSPLTVTVVDKLDQNPHAMFEGATGAPKIQKAALDADVVDSTKVDFANCDGMLGTIQQEYETTKQYTGVSTYSTVDTTYIYIPPDATTMHYLMRISTSNVSYPSGGRLIVASANGTTSQTNSAAAEWDTTDRTLDISSESGWTLLSIQVYVGAGGSHTGYLYEWTAYIA